jgi:predicted PurR-regulated permease PerM
VSASSTVSALRWALAVLTAAALYVCWPLWPALILASWTAELARPLLERFERRLRGRRAAAAVLSLMLFLALLIPVGLVTLAVVSGAHDLWQAVAESSSAKSALEAIAAGTGAAQSPEVPTSVRGTLELIQRYGAQGLNLLGNVAGAAARGLVGLAIYMGGAFVFLVDGPTAWSWLKRYSPLEPNDVERFTAAFHETGRGLFIGVGLTAASQGLAATLVYAGLGVSRWWVLGPITGLSAMVPLVGSSLVWAPISLGLALGGHPVKAAVLAALGVGVISSMDNVLRPLYARLGALKLPAFVLFVSVFGGIATLGPWGALLGPLVLRLWMEAVVLRREANGAIGAQPPARRGEHASGAQG